MTALSELYRQQDALGLADLVRRGDVSAEQLLEVAISRAEAVNPSVNAIITPLYDYAREQLRQGVPDGPFSGVPFLLKDLLGSLTGTPLSNGSRALKGRLSTEDSELVKRFKRTGVVIFGKTNTPEFGLKGVTEPQVFGATRNPWNLDRTPGGSSGGSGAAVAAGIVPMASAGDGGGSIRIPAACCGLFGLKPSRGLVPTGPNASERWDGAVSEHVLTRSVRDSAAMLDAVVGADDSSPYPIHTEATYLDSLAESLPSLRIGFTTQSFVGGAVSDDAKAAVETTATLLTSLGHRVEAIDWDLDAGQLVHAYSTLYFGHVAADIGAIATELGQKFGQVEVEDATRVLGYLGKVLSAGEFVDAKYLWNRFARRMHDYHRHYDLILTPTIASEPIAIGATDPTPVGNLMIKVVNGLRLHRALLKSGAVHKMMWQSLEKTPFTQLANLTGQPAMSVPLYWTDSGMPLGSQFMAPLGQDRRLLQLAAQLEQAQPWFERAAPL
ncbi:hypothetical protein BGP77_06510 [Saccharospirillum sp. MSK14-1]|uniref:amidase n=1 Tax=Saccharospirillum sp. MSK14-1 TaxID=1897632 RepID=UPI000D38F2EC|nr:amidase [Saccharospirillum sp. MSK14-1]PTY36933.1 hypothetical protein BGP77_06510 [Saccharospirillum sp. MSK14-1]